MDDQIVRRYLLGDVTEEQRARIEERCFTDHEFFEQTLAAEEQLIDDYLRNALGPAKRRRFEEHFLASPRRRARVEFAAAVMEKLSRPAPPRPRLVGRLALVATFAALALAAVWLQAQRSGLRREVSRLQADLERKVSPPTVSFVLTPGLVRDVAAAPRRLVIPPDSRVRLELELRPATPYSRYRVFVRTPEGEEVWSQEVSAPVVELPPGILRPGDYVVSVQGVTAGGEALPLPSYSFRAVGE
jgi:hypothetical protein